MNKRPSSMLDDYSGDPHGESSQPGDEGTRNVFTSSLGMITAKVGGDTFGDPLLMSLTFNGGPNKTRAIPTSGPAYNGIPAKYCGLGGEEMDENFNARPALGLRHRRLRTPVGRVWRPTCTDGITPRASVSSRRPGRRRRSW
jgi:hypothetical protein